MAGNPYSGGGSAGGGEGELHASVALGAGEDGLKGGGTAVESAGAGRHRQDRDEEHEGDARDVDGGGSHVLGVGFSDEL